jgi:hypothetical protein
MNSLLFQAIEESDPRKLFRAIMNGDVQINNELLPSVPGTPGMVAGHAERPKQPEIVGVRQEQGRGESAR